MQIRRFILLWRRPPGRFIDTGRRLFVFVRLIRRGPPELVNNFKTVLPILQVAAARDAEQLRRPAVFEIKIKFSISISRSTGRSFSKSSKPTTDCSTYYLSRRKPIEISGRGGQGRAKFTTKKQKNYLIHTTWLNKSERKPRCIAYCIQFH